MVGDVTGAGYVTHRGAVAAGPAGPACLDAVSAPVDHYAAHDVAPDAPPDEIRAAWRLRVVAFHPDRFRDDDQRRRAEELSQRANAAWLVLGDPVQRARYDRGRRTGPENRYEHTTPVPVTRRMPCPSCATRCETADAGGLVVSLTCGGCGEEFSALVGGRCLGRAHLERRWMGLRYEMLLRGPDGAVESVMFRRLPPELAISEGELLSIVFHPRTGRPVYAIAHDDGLDLGWRVG